MFGGCSVKDIMQRYVVKWRVVSERGVSSTVRVTIESDWIREECKMYLIVN